MLMRKIALLALLTMAVSLAEAQERPTPVSPSTPPPLKLDDPPPALPTQPEIPPGATTKPAAPPSPLPLLPPSTPPNLTPPSTPAQPPAASTPAPTQPAGPSPATITVQVPANASLWFGEQKMNQTGPTRTFKSPPLESTKTYMYKVKVSWPSAPGQKDYSSDHEITVRGGQTTIIDFTPLARGPVPTNGPPVGTMPPPQGQPTSRFGIPNIFRPTGGQRPQ